MGKNPIRKVVTYGLCNVAIGERHAAIDQEANWNDQKTLEAIEEKVRKIWNDRWQQHSTRIYVVEPQPPDEYGEEGQLHLIVEFEGETTAMQNVPVLFEECCYDGKEQWTMRQAAYMDHVVSWYGASEQLGLASEELCRKGNYLCVWIGSRLITDDDKYLVPNGCKFTMSYRTCGNGEPNEGGEQAAKKMRTNYEVDGSQRETDQGEENDQGEDEEDESEDAESENPATSDEEDDPSRAYMFHWVGDYAYERLDHGNPGHRRAMVAAVWEIDVEEVIGLHPLRARPPDLRPDHEALITRWKSDNDHRQWLTDVQILLDIRLEGRGQGVKRRSVRWIRHQMTRQGILRWLRIDDYCRRTMGGQCQIWFSNVLWQESDPEIKNVKMGDYVRVSLPPEATRSVWEQERGLRRLERIQREERFFEGADTASESDEDGQEEDPGPEPHAEPEPNAELRYPIALEERIDHDKYQPRSKLEDDSTQQALDFGAVWDLLAWMDAAITIPAWLPPEGLEWHPSTKQWIEEMAWWNMEPPDEIWYYTDGSKLRGGSGAATIMYIKSEDRWYYGGYLSQPCPVRCAHFAEIVAIGMSMHWLNNILMYCAMTQAHMPAVVFAFDATSAGYKVFGRWGGDKYPEETNNLRSVWMMTTMRYQFAWHTQHQNAHVGDPGNEGADTLAKGAAMGQFRRRSTSTWATYLTTTNEMAVHWLWSLWKSEWKGFWQGRLLHLPGKPETQPSSNTLQHLLQQEAQAMDPEEEQVLQCNCATANVLSLLPASKKWKEYGLFGKTRTEAIQKMCVEAQLHVVGLQETRIQGEKANHTMDYWVFAGSATQRGHYGVQLWFAKQLAFDQDNGQCLLQLDHFKILHQSPRLLLVKVAAPFLKAIFVCGHAPHSAATDEEKTVWWEALQEATPSKYQEWKHFLFIDANARLGDCISEGVSDHQAEKQDLNGDLLQEYLVARQMWLPSTFETVHRGEGGTWYHQQQDKWLRCDYVGLPCDLPLHHCRSRLCKEVEIAMQKDDHRVAMVTIGWNWCVPSTKKKQRHGPRDDGKWLQELLHGEQAYQYAISLQEAMPRCDWSVDTHTQMKWVQSSLRGWVRSQQPPRRQIPRKKSMSEATWNLVCEKRELRGWLHLQGTRDCRALLQQVFAIWSGRLTGKCDNEDKEDRFEYAKALHRFRQLGRAVTQAMRNDDRHYFEKVAASMSELPDEQESKTIWESIKWTLPKTRQRKRQSPLLLEALDSQWHAHFAQLEAGELVDPTKLVQDCAKRQQQREQGGRLTLADMPTLIEVEQVLRRMQPAKAPGPDNVPSALLHYGAAPLAVGVHDLYAKTVAWQAEAVQSKGGCMYPIWKRGNQQEAKSYRGVMLLNSLSKGFHALMRRRLMQYLEEKRMDTQIGGFSKQQAQFGSQCVQVTARICENLNLSMGCLFIDVRGAYHYLIRDLVMGADNDQDLEGVIRSLQEEDVDTRGVRLWAQVPSILERIGVDKRLIAMLREIHVDTWASMPHIEGTLRTRRGSRPGSPLADAIFHALMLDLHTEVHRILEEDAIIVAGFEKAGLGVNAVTWADDLTIPVITETGQELPGAIQRVMSRVYVAFERKGLILNMEQHKTAGVLHFRGAGAPALRKEHLLIAKPGQTIPIGQGRECWLHYVASYKHLGTMFCAGGDLSKEVHHRIGIAAGTFQSMKKAVFGNRHIGAATKLKLLEALVFSQLYYGLSTWESLGTNLIKKLNNFTLKCQRYVCKYKIEGSNDGYRGLWVQPTAELRLAAGRLQYAARVWTVGPKALVAALEREAEVSTRSWMEAILHDLEWCRNMLQQQFPSEEVCPFALAHYWRNFPKKWKRLVKKAYTISLFEEATAAEVRAWHQEIFAVVKTNGGEIGGRGTEPDGMFTCHCGKVCRNAQGLSVHKWKKHAEHAPEHRFVSGASCPICLRWLWSSHRVRMHLSYVPRNGGVNKCYEALMARGNVQEEESRQLVKLPAQLKGFRLESLQCYGPAPIVQRAVDEHIQFVEKELFKAKENLKSFPRLEEIPLDKLDVISGSFRGTLEVWRERFGQVSNEEQCVKLRNMWIDVLCELADYAEGYNEYIVSVVFLEWGRNVLPSLYEDWADGEMENVVEEAFYKVAMDIELYHLESEEAQLQSRLHHAIHRRDEEDKIPEAPHRPARYGPAYKLGGRKQITAMARRYRDQDGWHRSSSQWKWEREVRECPMPWLRQVKSRKCYLILHFFSGRRRKNDFHDAVNQLTANLPYDVVVLSLDTAVDGAYGDLASGGRTWQHLTDLIIRGGVAAALAGPPCETFTEARHWLPEDISPEEAKKWPRPLRSNEEPWGLPNLKLREVKQLKQGSVFALQMLWAMAALWAKGGCMLLEHPAPPKRQERATIFRTPIVQLLLQLVDFNLNVIRQKEWGGLSPKPTGILAMRTPNFWRSMRRWATTSKEDEKKSEPMIGREDGGFRTAKLKEYPTNLAYGFAQTLLDRIAQRHQAGPGEVQDLPKELLQWCDRAHEVSSKIRTEATMLPDFQG